MWNEYNEYLIKKWSVMCKTYSIMHSISADYYNKLDRKLGIPVILLGAVSASSIFTTSSNSSEIWSYINGCLVLIMTGVSGVSKFLGTSEKFTKHTSASFKYTEISMNIDTLLSFPISEREEKCREFINSVKNSILEIREHSPEIPSWVKMSYIKNLDKSITNTETKINRFNIYEVEPKKINIESKNISSNGSVAEGFFKEINDIDVDKDLETLGFSCSQINIISNKLEEKCTNDNI